MLIFPKTFKIEISFNNIAVEIKMIEQHNIIYKLYLRSLHKFDRNPFLIYEKYNIPIQIKIVDLNQIVG